jgi:hypothetical protein
MRTSRERSLIGYQRLESSPYEFSPCMVQGWVRCPEPHSIAVLNATSSWVPGEDQYLNKVMVAIWVEGSFPLD